MTNQELIEKATITTSNLANAGLLNAEQANKFIDYVIDETSDAVKKARVVRFKASQRLIEKLNVANRVAVPKAEAADPGIRRGVSSSKVTLEHHEIMVPFEVGDIVKEENIEGDAIEEHIIKMMATRLGNNIEELYWDGNTTGPAQTEEFMLEGGSGSLYVLDSYLGMFNGWLKNADSGHIVDAAGAPMSPALISRALNAMPNKFKKNKANLKFYLSWDHEQAYRERVSTRATGQGDDALRSQGNVPAFGIELMPVSLLQAEPQVVEDVVANSDGTTASALAYAPVTNLVITPTTLGANPLAAYIEDTDYTVDEEAGTWIRDGGGAIPSGGTVKCTYNAAGQMLLTTQNNLIVAIGRDIRIERQRNIFKGVNEFAITAKIFCIFEETDAVVKVQNIAVPS